MSLTGIVTLDALAYFGGPCVLAVRFMSWLNACQDSLRKRVPLVHRKLYRNLGQIIDCLYHFRNISDGSFCVQSSIRRERAQRGWIANTEAYPEASHSTDRCGERFLPILHFFLRFEFRI